MRRLFAKAPRFIGFIGFVGVALLCQQGCADNDTALFIRGVVKLDSNCVAVADPNTTVLGAGVIDTAFASGGYVASLLVGNQLVRRGSKNQLRTETSRVVLKGAEVSVLNDQEEVIDEYTVPGVGFADVGSGEDPGYGILSAYLLPPDFAASPGALFISEVKVFGTTIGGSDLESVPLRFPIYVCQGCLISYPADADDPAQAGYQCVTGKTSATPPCRLGQDDPIDCRLCATNPVCQTP